MRCNIVPCKSCLLPHITRNCIPRNGSFATDPQSSMPRILLVVSPSRYLLKLHITPYYTKKRDLSLSFSFGYRQRPTLPGRVQPSTIGAEGLNCCVRYGYRWFPFAIATGFAECLSPYTHNCIVSSLFPSPSFADDSSLWPSIVLLSTTIKPSTY